jgi:glycine/D-amino acid oxidase-like deaminating enzyme
MAATRTADAVVVGGGLVGAAVAYGLALRGLQVTVLDEGDVALRASRGNFGLVWVQNKGVGLPRYAEWSRDAAALMPSLAASMAEETGIDIRLHQPGGFCFCFSDEELEKRDASLRSLRDAVSGPYPYTMLGNADVKARIPVIGPEVVGASYTPMDGHVNPLKLLRALHQACRQRGVEFRVESRVDRIRFASGSFELHAGAGVHRAAKIVLAAGLGNRDLAPQLGLHAPVVPNRGQILVTERLQAFLHYPTNKIRQTDEGTVQLGDSVEDVGFDDSTTSDVMNFIARRAIRTFPLLRDVNLIRAWGALRVMSPDGFPVYDESSSCPGAFVATCHSGVTLAAAHALVIAPWVAGHAPPEGLEMFSGGRFKRAGSAAMFVN